MKKTYNWGIIGLGHIARKFASDLQIASQSQLYAVASRTQEKANKFAQKYKAQKAYDSYEKLAQDPNVDIIYIATPQPFHCEQAIMCLEHKKPVLCEKPLATNSLEVKKIIQTAQDNNTFLLEALWSRFVPHTKKILELIEAGTIGKIKHLRADYGRYFPYDPDSRMFKKELGGSSLFDVGIYPLYFSLLLFGKPIKYKALASFGRTGIDESCGMLLQYSDGQIAFLLSTFVADTNMQAEIYGEKGRIKIDHRFHGPADFSLILENGKTQNYNFEKQGFGYQHEIEEAIHCLDNQQLQSKLFDWQDSINLMELLDKIKEECGIKAL